MSLYRCTTCNVVENTALGGYWIQQMDAAERGEEFKPRCSLHNPAIGCWHGQFPRQQPTDDMLVDNRGFLWRPSQIVGLEHLGPFTPLGEVKQ